MRERVEEPNRDLITSAQVGQIIERTPDTVRVMARKGRLVVVATVGNGTRLFSRQAAERMAAERRGRRS